MRRFTKYTILIIAFYFPIQLFAQADSIKEIAQKYDGTWFNKKDNRYITINADTTTGDITINDWTGKRNAAKATNIDAYKVFPKDGKLVSYADDTDHHCTYCEITLEKETLTYECNGGLNFKDNFLNRKKPTYKVLFKRVE